MLPFRARVDLGAMVITGTSPSDDSLFRTLDGRGSYPSTKVQSVYPAAPADRVKRKLNYWYYIAIHEII